MKKIDRNGFTLIEVLIFSAIFGIVIGAIYMMYSTSHTTFTRGQNKIEAQQNGRVAMEMMAREIRTAGYDPSDVISDPDLATASAIQVANANSVTFIADVEVLPCAGNDVSDWVAYRLQGTQLIRDTRSCWNGTDWNPILANPPDSSVMADGVSVLNFTYYDGSDNVTATLADIRRITIQLTTQESDGLRTESFPLSMDVRLRNLQ